MKIRLYIIISTLFFLLSSFIETEKRNTFLFKIERSKDDNQIYYTVNTDNQGDLNLKKPIKTFWIKHTKKGRVEPLTWIQKKYAYGLKYLHCCENCASFQFVSYDKCNFLLKKFEDKYHVFTKIDDQILEVERIFVQIDGGTFWVPNVTEIQLHAHDFKTGKEVLHVITP